MLDNAVLMVECEAKKTDESGEAVYLLLVAAFVDSKLKLDERISEILKTASYSLIYSSEASSLEQYLARSDKYQLQAHHLCEQVSNDDPIRYAELHLLEEENAEAQSYLAFNEQALRVIDDNSSAEPADTDNWQQPWISDDLKLALFSQPNNQEILNTYLIVDATLRAQITGFFDLDIIQHCEVKCLFKGRAADTLKTAAPYLIDITLSPEAYADSSQVSKFHRDFIENHWAHNTGIIIRTSASMDEVLHHYRRFTKVQNAEGEWVFFRFWDPNILIPYLTGIQHWKERIALWFNLDRGLVIESVMANSIAKDTLMNIAPKQSIKEISKRYPAAYTQEDFEILEEEFLKYRSKKIIAKQQLLNPERTEINHRPATEFLQQQIDWLHQHSFFESTEIESILEINQQYQCSINNFPQPLKSLLADQTLTFPARTRLAVKHAKSIFEQAQ